MCVSIYIKTDFFLPLSMINSKNVYKYFQKDLTSSFHCQWYLKISSGSNMFKYNQAYKQKCVYCDQVGKSTVQGKHVIFFLHI